MYTIQTVHNMYILKGLSRENFQSKISANIHVGQYAGTCKELKIDPGSPREEHRGIFHYITV